MSSRLIYAFAMLVSLGALVPACAATPSSSTSLFLFAYALTSGGATSANVVPTLAGTFDTLDECKVVANSAHDDTVVVIGPGDQFHVVAVCILNGKK